MPRKRHSAMASNVNPYGRCHTPVPRSRSSCNISPAVTLRLSSRGVNRARSRPAYGLTDMSSFTFWSGVGLSDLARWFTCNLPPSINGPVAYQRPLKYTLNASRCSSVCKLRQSSASSINPRRCTYCMRAPRIFGSVYRSESLINTVGNCSISCVRGSIPRLMRHVGDRYR